VHALMEHIYVHALMELTVCHRYGEGVQASTYDICTKYRDSPLLPIRHTELTLLPIRFTEHYDIQS
jgi:hypothetical protein